MLKYTDATLVLNTEAQSDGSSADQSVEESSEADLEEGSPTGPAMPALFTEGGKASIRKNNWWV